MLGLGEILDDSEEEGDILKDILLDGEIDKDVLLLAEGETELDLLELADEDGLRLNETELLGDVELEGDGLKEVELDVDELGDTLAEGLDVSYTA